MHADILVPPPAAAAAAAPSCVQGGAIDPVRLLQDLIRFPTETDCRDCVDYIARLLRHFGIDSSRYARDPARPCLLARIAGRGAAPPLLLYGHVDVVPVAGQSWSVDPYAGLIRDGFVWGRGALDMKGGLAMLLTAFVEARAAPPPGDLLLCIVSDEEVGGRDGAGFLVEQHAQLFEGVRHALGEFGGFSFDLFGRRFMPIQVDERQFVGVVAQVSEAGGHAALGGAANAAVTAAELVRRVARLDVPVCLTPATRDMLRQMAAALPLPAALVLRLLAMPATAPLMLKLLGRRASALGSCMRSAVTPTIVRCGSKRNVVPASATVEMDMRLVPGDDLERLVARIRDLAPPGVRVSAEAQPRHKNGLDMSQYPRLAALLRRAYPQAVPVPMLLPGTTDARHFNRLGIQTYGFLPVDMPRGMAYMNLIHGADERIPAAALAPGSRLIAEFIAGYGA